MQGLIVRLTLLMVIIIVLTIYIGYKVNHYLCNPRIPIWWKILILAGWLYIVVKFVQAIILFSYVIKGELN